MLIKSLKLTNFLSFGENSQELELRPLNVFIGPNGSGKSNLLEAIDLLRAAPRDILAQVRNAGGIYDLLWKGNVNPSPVATIDVVLNYPEGEEDLRYTLSFTEVAQRFKISSESILGTQPSSFIQADEAFEVYYKYVENCTIFKNKRGKELDLGAIGHDVIDTASSVLAQRRDPDQYAELTWVGDIFGKIRLYRDWHFGPASPARQPQTTDMPNYWLEPDISSRNQNLWLVLATLRNMPAIKQKLLDALRVLYNGIDDFGVHIEGGTVQVFFQEGNYIIPATRLSDGTLRYLRMLAILCHPNPPPLICIEEPELGLHPDVLPTLANLLVDASEHTQLIVTTHSDILVDALSDQSDAIVVAEKGENGTTLKRLDAEDIKPWLEKYSLGQLWTRGKFGGLRW